ncbi:HD domain-containing phosphohydrolase [Vreelandella rituensis]|uniref:Phosphohydrolase n=1 Tax=Vreelandella rituensis TaxID=2282306 RepID=A0A368U6I7_9GAMM|nr:HD domain-containing phosphohydrolase [Halomonas rituensis]RCV92067.1 phosphohydrolase [Halomonas rituensis]
MAAQQDEFEKVIGPVSIEALLNALVETGGVSLQVEQAEAEREPIVLMEQHSGQMLVVDLSSVTHLLAELEEGTRFCLSGQTEGKLVRTSPLVLTETRRSGGRFLCCCEYPEYLEVLQRRESFRAELRMGMEVIATLYGEDDMAVQGDLRDLSQDGCQLELPMAASGLLASASSPLKIEFHFPDGTHFLADVTPCHQKTDADHKLLRLGCRFYDCSTEQERQIWYFVCEIEREAARYKKDVQGARLPSPLFEPKEGKSTANENIGRRDVKRYATPMARRLVKVAAYLDAQMLTLQQGSDIDSRQLSRYTDRLLVLHDEDREALLFASRCMTPEPLLVRHGLAVAIHLLDLVGKNIPGDVRKAIAASALVHDLGKALVPQVLFKSANFEAPHRQTLSEHVPLLLDRLKNCTWLSGKIATAVIGGINERMDGSGYPAGLIGDELHELARASAIVDVVEAMRRNRIDRPARTVQEIYRHLLRHPHQFDPRWMRRYVQHFKVLPIGSLVRFSSDQLAWIQRIDGQGNPVEVQLTQVNESPTRENLGASIRGNVLEKLGKPVGEVAVST